jgi:ribulose-phosphate 3-epimerase
MPSLPAPRVIPAILAKSQAEFRKKIRLMDGVTDLVQVDVMDGRFVPNATWHVAKEVAKIRTSLQFELHLMVQHPLPIITDWMKVKGLRRVIFHAESAVRLTDMIREARERCLHVGVAISPGTPLKRITPYLKRVDLVLVMGGKPGFSGKPLDSNTIDTVRTIRKIAKRLPIGFDIGVSKETIPTLVQAGVTHLYAASAVFNTKNPTNALKPLQRIAEHSA